MEIEFSCHLMMNSEIKKNKNEQLAERQMNQRHPS